MGFTNEKDAVSPTLVDDAMRMYYMARTSEGFKNLPLELSNQEWCLTSQEIWDYTTNPQQVISHGSTERMDTYPPSDEWCFQPARHDSWLSWGPQSSTAWWLNKHPEQPVSWDHSRMANINPPTSGWIKTCGTTSLLVGFGDLLLSQNPIKKVAETSLSVEASPIQRRVVWISHHPNISIQHLRQTYYLTSSINMHHIFSSSCHRACPQTLANSGKPCWAKQCQTQRSKGLFRYGYGSKLGTPIIMDG